MGAFMAGYERLWVSDRKEPTMAHFLFTLPDGGGVSPPIVGLAGALVARGYDVRVLADPVLRPDVEAAGARFRPWTRAPYRTASGRDTEILRDWGARTPAASFAILRDEIMVGPADRYAADVLEELAREPADAIATETVLFGTMVAAEHAGVPLAVLSSTVLPLPVPGRPLFGPGFQPAPARSVASATASSPASASGCGIARCRASTRPAPATACRRSPPRSTRCASPTQAQRDVTGPQREDEQVRGPRRTADEMRDELQRRGVGPVEVGEEQHERLAGREHVERRPRGVVQAPALAGVRRRPGRRIGQRRERASQLGHGLGAQRALQTPAAALQRLVERVDPEGERHVALELGRAAVEDAEAALARLRRERFEQPRLADAGLADDIDDPSDATAGGGEGVAQGGELRVAAGQRRLHQPRRMSRPTAAISSSVLSTWSAPSAPTTQ
ncbi:MAG: glycosyltransferase, family [Conexibacter sp.]|nr:glycosyltransferase, family [Conexibacter sp.]